ncbi:RING finger and transmembrane domain-containing protein 2 isoform X1, partial [Silurus asotus]
RNRSQTLGSESSLDEGGVFDCLKPESPTSPQQLFSGLVGVSAGAMTSTPFQAAGLVLGSPPEVFIQMTTSSREESSHRADNAAFLPRPAQQYHHHHHHHHFHQSGQHRSALLHSASSAERHSRDDGGDEASSPAPALSELKAVVTWLQRGFPFILILLIKVCFQHKLGIAVCIGMASTFAFANSTLKHQVSLREDRSIFVSLWILTFLGGNIVYVYYTFSSEELHNSLIFAKPNINSYDFFDLIWVVGITDFVLKYFTIAVKCLVLFLPKILLAFKSRMWYKYIMGEDPSSSYFLGAVLIIIYSLCKSFDLCGRISGIRKAFLVLCSSQSYGIRASTQQCSEAGDVCAICQADFREPVALLCQRGRQIPTIESFAIESYCIEVDCNRVTLYRNGGESYRMRDGVSRIGFSYSIMHVFCEDCLCLWFDRERTCPLCRAAVVETPRSWKDGTTSAHFQIY